MKLNFRICLATVLVFISCGANVVFLEHLVKFSPGCGDLITFAQFLFISLYGFIYVSDCGTKKPVVPIRRYLLAVALFYGSSLSGNLAFACHISMPIQMLFKSGSVLASLTLGVLLLKKSYSLTKYISVVMISVGIAMCLLISVDDKPDAANEGDLITWLFGIFLLFASLFMGARLGVAQEEISRDYGKHPQELLFYSHVLALPGFLLVSPRIYRQFTTFSSAETIVIPFIQYDVSIVWIYLALNVLTQFICIRSVYVLATEMTSLAVTVTLTLRKFMSIVISIIYFQNPFTVYHWFGTVLVFSGSLMFSDVIPKLWRAAKQKKTE